MIKLLKYTITQFLKDNAPRLAAALSFYTIFSLAPILIIAVAVIGVVFGEDAAKGLIVEQLGELIGENAAAYIERLILQAAQPASGFWATLVSVIILLYGASRIFNHLRLSLNTIWNVKEKEGLGILHKIKVKAFALILVLFTGLILLATIIVNTIVITVFSHFEEFIPTFPFFWQTVNFFFLYVITTAVFTLIFKFIPSVQIDWNPAIVGALFTAALFSLGRILLGVYLGTVTVTSTYGAAGSLVIVLLWIYYSAQILFLGAEFTQAYARKHGTPIEPSSSARKFSHS